MIKISFCLRLLIVVCAGLVIVGCASPQAKPGDWERVVQGRWALTHLDGRTPLAHDTQPTEPLTLELSNDGRVAGFAGANRFFGSYESTPTGDLRFAALGSTRMFRDDPPGLMAQEQRYFELLGEIDAYRLQDDKLFLLSDGKKRLVYRPAAEADAEPGPAATPG